MKILHILYSGIGGVFNVVDTLIKNPDDRHDGVIYVGPKLSKNSLSHKKLLKRNFFYIKTIKYLTALYVVGIFKKIKKFKPEIIVLHNYHILPCLISKLIYKHKIIYVDHKPLETKSFKDFFIIFFFQYFIDIYVALNEENFIYIKKKIFSKNKVKKIYNGVELNYFKSNLNKKFYPLKIGMAGRMNNTKLQSIMINVTQSLLRKNINIYCYFAGSGENINYLKKLVTKKNKKKIIFSGSLSQSELKKWFNKINLYVQSSKGEGMSISILQAMSMGIPVMGSNVSGIKNLKYPSKLYKMVFSNNEQDLEKKIMNFFFTHQNIKNKIISEQTLYLNNFSSIKMRNNYNFVFKKLLKKSL